MSYNGSGTFLINSAGQPVVANTVISATVFNALTSDLATGLSTAITKDGQTTITNNIPFGSNKITGLGSGTAAADAANLGQVQSTVAKLITVTGTDTITGSMSPQLTAYAAGQLFYFVANAANTGAVTLNIDSLGAKSITRDGSSALAAGDINSGEVVVVIYDGTRFQMINAANSFGNTTINGTLTVTGNTALQANVSITSTLSVHGTFGVTGAATLGSTLAVTGKSDLPTVSTASVNAAVAAITTATVTNLTATSASVASVNAGVALLTTATVTNLTATGASIASANIGNLQFTAASIASINAGVAVITNLSATSASIASMNAGVSLLTTATVTNLTATGASIASANIGNLQFTAASIASINAGVAVITNLTATGASIASANVGTAVITAATVTGASIASVNAGTAVITALTVTGASVASANFGNVVTTTERVTNLSVTNASVASINAAVALITTGTVTSLTSTGASIASANVGVGVITALTVTGASVASANVGTAVVTGLTVTGASIASVNVGAAVFSGNLTLNGGSANGVLYLDGSKVATSGSALTFNGTTFTAVANAVVGDGTAATRRTLIVNGGANAGVGAYLGVQVGGSLVGTLASSGWAAGDTSTDLAVYADTGKSIRFYSAGAEGMRLTSTGLGIGTTSPSQRLHVEGGNARINRSSDATILFLGGSPSANWEGDIQFVTSNTVTNWRLSSNRGAAGAFTITPSTVGGGSTFTTPAITIDSASNLGLGTTSPIYKLHVENNAASTTNIAVLNTSASSGAYAQVRVQGDSGIGYFGYAGSGNAAGGLYDADCVYLASESTAAALCIGTSGGSAPIRFFTNGSTAASERMRLDASGNLVIGTTTVAGGARVTSSGDIAISGSGTGARLRNQTTTISVSTTATTIIAGGDLGQLVVVNGQSGADRFCDLVLSSTSVAPTVVQSFTASGTPAARTYTRSSTNLQLAMASGTYVVAALSLGF